MPTTAAYAVAASVVAPGLIQMGLEPLAAHMFVFYFAVMSAITPPVALAAYAAAGVAGTDPIQNGHDRIQTRNCSVYRTLYVYLQSRNFDDGYRLEDCSCHHHGFCRIYFLAAMVQGWFAGTTTGWLVRILLLSASITLINANLYGLTRSRNRAHCVLYPKSEEKQRFGNAHRSQSHVTRTRASAQRCWSGGFLVVINVQGSVAKKSSSCRKLVRLPESQSKLPESESKLPESQSKLPESKSKLPESQSKLPESKSKLPES